MFSILQLEPNVLALKGRFDAAQAGNVSELLESLNQSTVVDFAQCGYIASAGLSVLFVTQKRLNQEGQALVLRNLSPHLREIFQLAGFDKIFTIEAQATESEETGSEA